MAKKRKSTSKAKAIISIAAATAGGFAGGQLTNVLQNQVAVLGSNPFYAPGVTMLLGIAANMSVKNPIVKSIGEGAAIVAGTELLEKAMVKMLPAPTVNGPKTGAYSLV